MNKYLKICLVVILTIIATVAILFCCLFGSMNTNTKKAEADSIKYAKECEAIMFITEKPSITIEGFNKTEIEELKFYIVVNNKILQDTLISYKTELLNNYLSTKIPFQKFNKLDTIIVETKSKKYFRITNFEHYAYLHYGMFGYLGSHECRIASNKLLVNGQATKGFLLKQNAINKNILPQ